jgi:lysozyme family protein
MTAENYPSAMKRVLVFEGGKVDHPKDPGGRTNQGVIQRVYDGWRSRNSKPKRDVYLMEPAERDAIYREGYWNQIRGDDLPAGIDVVVFDGAVNSGPQQSIKWLQRALMVTRIDGVVGPATLDAIDRHPDHDLLIAAICERRLAFLQALKTWATFKKGWSSRVTQARQIGQAWATGSVGPQPIYLAGMNTKAPIEHAKPLPVKAAADAATGAGVASGGLAGALDQARETLSPLAGGADWIGNIVAALALVGVAMTIGGIGYRWYASRKAVDAADALDLPSGVTA